MDSSQPPAKRKSIVTEFAAFAVGIGLLLAALAYYTLTGLKRAPDLYGVKRGLALGVPFGVLAALNLGAGIALYATRRPWAVVACMAAGIAVSVVYLVFELAVMGFLEGRLISVAMYAVPFLMASRGPKALEEIRALDRAGARKEPGAETSTDSAER